MEWNAKGYLSRLGVYTSGVGKATRMLGDTSGRRPRHSSLDIAVMPEGSAHLVHVVLSVVGVGCSSGTTRVVALGRASVGASANAHGAVEVGAETGRAAEDPASANLAAYSSGVGDEGAILAFAGGRASSARVDGDLGVDALV